MAPDGRDPEAAAAAGAEGKRRPSAAEVDRARKLQRLASASSVPAEAGAARRKLQRLEAQFFFDPAELAEEAQLPEMHFDRVLVENPPQEMEEIDIRAANRLHTAVGMQGAERLGLGITSTSSCGLRPLWTAQFLERYTRRADSEFLCCEDCEPLRLAELLKLADDDLMGARWEGLALGTVSGQGGQSAELVQEIRRSYANVPHDGVLIISPAEGIHHTMHAMLREGDTVIVQWPAGQALVEVAQDIRARILLWTPTAHFVALPIATCRVSVAVPCMSSNGGQSPMEYRLVSDGAVTLSTKEFDKIGNASVKLSRRITEAIRCPAADSARMCCARATRLDRPDGSLRFDVSVLRALMGASSPAFSPKLLVMSCPNAPTGWTPSAEEHCEIIEICRRHGSYLFSDEVLRGLEHQGCSHVPAAVEVYDLAVSLGSVGSACGLAGLNIGWLASRNTALLQRVAEIRDYTSPHASLVNEHLALIALRSLHTILQHNRELLHHNLRVLHVFCQRHPEILTWSPPRAGVVAFLQLGSPSMLGFADSGEYCSLLAETQGIVLCPDTCYGYERGSRVRVGYGRRNLESVLEKYASIVKRLGPCLGRLAVI